MSRKLLFTALAAFAITAALPATQTVYAQAAAQAPMTREAAAGLYAKGLAMEKRKDAKGAFSAFLAAAENGYPPAQRRLGEIYGTGNSAVERDFAESTQWYQKAREGGEKIATPKPHGMQEMSPTTFSIPR